METPRSGLPFSDDRLLTSENRLYHLIQLFLSRRLTQFPPIDNERRCASHIKILAELLSLDYPRNCVRPFDAHIESGSITYARLGCELVPRLQTQLVLFLKEPVVHRLESALLSCALRHARGR